jgi:SAM-dependent methyltransferase
VNQRYTDYDPIAHIYNEYWGPRLAKLALHSLEKLMLPRLSPGARILDLCCGTGQLAALLVQRGYRVTGLDSPGQIALARANAPGANFIVDDARSFQVSEVFDAVVSTSDAFNHVLSIEELKEVFNRVNSALRPGGYFVFDMNLPERYERVWNSSMGVAHDDLAWIGEGTYKPLARTAFYKITAFERQGADQWKRSETTLTQRAYTEAELRAALDGFSIPEVYDADGDLGAESELGLKGQAARMYFVTTKQ